MGVLVGNSGISSPHTHTRTHFLTPIKTMNPHLAHPLIAWVVEVWTDVVVGARVWLEVEGEEYLVLVCCVCGLTRYGTPAGHLIQLPQTSDMII